MLRTIKVPIALTLVSAVVITSVLAMWLTIKEHERLYTASVEQDLHVLTANLADELSGVLVSSVPPTEQLRQELATLASYQHILEARVYNSAGELIYEQGRAEYNTSVPLSDLLTQSPATFSMDDKLIATRHIINDDTKVGYLMIVNDVETPVSNSWQTLMLHVLPFVAVALLLTIAVALVLLDRWLTPLSKLSAFTQRLSYSKDYTQRFDARSANEVGQLAAHINTLLDAIEAELTINQEQNQTLIEQQQTMTHLANFDSLTSLPNRQFVMDNLRLELARAKRLEKDIALLFFDLDGFKGINDSLGHEIGDLILIEVAERVTTMLRDGDLVARLGGDEFIIVPDRDVTDVSLKNLANRVIDAFRDPFHFRGLALTVGVSIGIAKASEASFELSQLMSNADLAMYRSKAKGRGIYTIFTNEMVESHKRKLSIANSIDQGLAENEFVLYYQPKVAKDGTLVGFEALIRWHHSEFGMINPAEFIPIAEQSGRISAITKWVIERVSAELPLLQSIFTYKFRVAINLSGHDLRHLGLFDMIHSIFTEQQVNPEYIEFEVTESAYLENFAFANRFFRRLSNMGCAIALDDFGTGYSSLSYLTQITIDTLKIDRQFVRELETSERSRLVTNSIIDLAKRLSLTICAEGIECVSQWEYLLDHGCDHVQGYLFSKPIPLEDVAALPERFTFPGRTSSSDNSVQ